MSETKSGTGLARLLYLAATSEGPSTAEELADVGSIGVKSARSTLTELHQRGFVIRQERDSEKRGPNPYEYAIRPRISAGNKSADTEQSESEPVEGGEH